MGDSGLDAHRAAARVDHHHADRHASAPTPSTPTSRRPCCRCVLPIAVMALPFLDVLLAIVRRTLAGRSPFAPDKQHLHHRLLERGHSHARAVLVMYLWSAVIAFGGDGRRLPGPDTAAGEPRRGRRGRGAGHDEHPAAAPGRGHLHRAAPRAGRRDGTPGGRRARRCWRRPSLTALAVGAAAASWPARSSSGLAGLAGGAARRRCWCSASCSSASCRVAQAARGRRGLGAMLLLLGYSTAGRPAAAVVFGAVIQRRSAGPRGARLTVIAVALGWTAGTVWTWLRWRRGRSSTSSCRPDRDPAER